MFPSPWIAPLTVVSSSVLHISYGFQLQHHKSISDISLPHFTAELHTADVTVRMSAFQVS